jgi:cell division protein FtsL
MSKKTSQDVEELLQRAHTDSAESRIAPEKEHRYVYNGNPTPGAAGYAIRPNKRAARRTVSTFNIILLLFGCGVAIVLYVSNIITVNRLALEVDQLRTAHDKIENTNAILKAEINRKSGWDRIGRIAGEQLGLKYPTTQATRFDIDADDLEKVQATK